MTRIMLFSTVMHNKKSRTEKHAAASGTISLAMRIRWNGAKHIAQYGRSRATLDATGRHHRAIIHPVTPRWMSWSSISA
jgi:hypothetical protein